MLEIGNNYGYNIGNNFPTYGAANVNRSYAKTEMQHDSFHCSCDKKKPNALEWLGILAVPALAITLLLKGKTKGAKELVSTAKDTTAKLTLKQRLKIRQKLSKIARKNAKTESNIKIKELKAKTKSEKLDLVTRLSNAFKKRAEVRGEIKAGKQLRKNELTQSKLQAKMQKQSGKNAIIQTKLEIKKQKEAEKNIIVQSKLQLKAERQTRIDGIAQSKVESNIKIKELKAKAKAEKVGFWDTVNNLFKPKNAA